MGRKPKGTPLLAPDGSGLASTYVLILIVGPNGCGKTTVAEQLATFYVRGTKVSGKAWAVDPNGAWTDSPDVKSIWPAEGDEGVDAMMRASMAWPPGLVIFDDADRNYFRYSSMITNEYLTSARHLRKDQIVISRSFAGIPKDAVRVAKAVILFAGVQLEPNTMKYLSALYPPEILDAIPTADHNYLIVVKDGAKLSYERRKTRARKIKTAGDKR